MKNHMSAFVGALLLTAISTARAAETEFLYLSGKGKDDMVKWDFWCSAGQNANKWSTIGVPSNWELQGFGIYGYGRPVPQGGFPKVQGKYKRTFNIAAETLAGNKKTAIVFEGVMTDTQVFINGQAAGAMHQGGYYRFKYDITKLLQAGENLLEVTVDDESANASVNSAERRGDYWNYAGIFRPVYLETTPPVCINQVAIDAQANGTLHANVAISAAMAAADTWVKLQVRDAAGTPFGDPVTQPLRGNTDIQINTKFSSPKLWTAETPNLYTLDVQLGVGAAELHTVKQKFGFRTIEARPGAGLFLNGSRIILKGADRHSFWPDSGRTLSEKISRDDITLMKEMNMNAVRMSHYPPDQHFLDACDEMGMYVLDELAGWHAKYDTPTGVRLVKEMVTRDVNHPSILFWDNGNEGGWNTALDGEFAKHDPQKRLVLHPWEEFPVGIIDTKHYPSYDLLNTRLANNAVFFPTEMLHGLYDGGHGAGLEDYWAAILKGKAAAGGFLWCLTDESLTRVDQGGKLDAAGNQSPDGIVGPYREKEGSFYTIKKIWSPIYIGGAFSASSGPATGSALDIENRFDFLDASQCKFTWEARKFRGPQEATPGYEVVAKGNLDVRTPIPPHTRGRVGLSSAAATYLTPKDGTSLAIRVDGPDGRELTTTVFQPDRNKKFDSLISSETKNAAVGAAAESPDAFTATAADLLFSFNKKTGLLASTSRLGKSFALANGPRLVAIGATPPPPARGAQPTLPTRPADSTLISFTQKTDGADLLLSASFDGPMKSIDYRLRPNGWLTIHYAYNLTGPHEFFGVGFDCPETAVQSMRYLGEGPATVYQNRIAGGTLDVWEKKYNNTMVGDPDDLKPGEHFDYPIFKGYYSGVQWLQLATPQGRITALVHEDNDPVYHYVQVLTPKLPAADLLGQTGVPFPNAGISFLNAIPAIGSKFNGPKSTGPQGQPAIAKGDYKGTISLFFGDIH